MTNKHKASRVMTPPEQGVRIRMYRQGLGDCFLLAFPRKGAKRPFYLMIDCGVIPGTRNATQKMIEVAADIRASTRDDTDYPDGYVDVLVASHEHADHLSGFIQANAEFEKLTIGTLWLGWTEDPGDKLANDLRNQRRKTREALRMALHQFKLAGDNTLADRVRGVLSFFGDPDDPTAFGGGGGLALTAGGKPRTVEDALRWLREKAEKTEYLRPGGNPRTPEGLEEVRIYVLGPPHHEESIKHSDASAAERKGNVVYQLGGELAMDMGFFSAMFDAAAVRSSQSLVDLETPDLTRPFDDCHRIRADRVGIPPRRKSTEPTPANGVKADGKTTRRVRAFVKEHYLGHRNARAANSPAWRKIDGDWLEVGAELALKLDSDTNNTSVALAIELKGGAVLLFPADAQVGNWTSWQTQTWRNGAGSDSKGSDVSARDLLGRTVFYKVGHHGSHNATLRVGGLEWMSNDLVAMMPVDEQVAHEVKKWIHMPLPSLVDALLEKTGGRLLRADKDVPPVGQLSLKLTKAARDQFVRNTSTSTRLYHELVIGK